MRKILFNRQSPEIQPIRELIERQKHLTICMWTLGSANRALKIFEDLCPGDSRPRDAVDAGKKWMRGDIKMPEAKRAILAAHSAANEIKDLPAAQAAARACAHAAGAVHVETHALGLIFYGLTAFIRDMEPEKATAGDIKSEIDWYCGELLYWENNISKQKGPFAPFLLKDAPNKEKLLRQKLESKNCAGQSD